MKWTEVKVIFEHTDRELAVELISDIFYDFGLQGVVVESRIPDEDADWAEGVMQFSETDSVSAYFPQNKDFAEKMKEIRKKLAQLEKDLHINTKIQSAEVDEEDWAESWKKYFRPEKVGNFIVVKPTWREYDPEPGEIVLEIDPGMAFGTGTHPSTSLCIQLIEKYIRPGDDVLDIGTGSGILLMTAQKMGAAALWGIDNDPVAVEVAEKNLLRNRADPSVFTLMNSNLADGIKQQFAIIAANILTDVILELADSIPRLLRQGGIFICSGIISENREKVTAKLENTGLEILEAPEKESWVGIAARKKICNTG